MKVTTGTKLLIEHARKGIFPAIANEDFDTETSEWFPVRVAGGVSVEGMTNAWSEDENIPCRATLVNKIEIVKDSSKFKLKR